MKVRLCRCNKEEEPDVYEYSKIDFFLRRDRFDRAGITGGGDRRCYRADLCAGEKEEKRSTNGIDTCTNGVRKLQHAAYR